MKKIPLFIAILMSINIVVGGGFFLSASKIFQTSGLLAPLTWLFCGLLMLPIVKVLADLSRLYPTAGGIYIYSKQNLGEFWGFVSGWGYFIGTLAGNAMILYAFSDLMQKLGLAPPISLFNLNIAFVIIFSLLNLLNITVLEKMHILFTVLKTIPIGLVLLSMLFLFKMNNLYAAPIKPIGLFSSMPIVLFAYLGIEACCAITHKIRDGERNASRAMLISLVIVVLTYAIVQFGLLGIVGVNSANPFFEIIPSFTSNPTIIKWGNLIVKLSILSSFLGGFYGMFYANSWNLYALAKEKTVLFSDSLTKLNRYNTPWTCILAQAVVVVLLLAIAFKSIWTLMIMSGFGVVIAYILSVITYFVAWPKTRSTIIIGSLALIGSGTLLILCFNDIANEGVRYLFPFLAILLSGIVLYQAKRMCRC